MQKKTSLILRYLVNTKFNDNEFNERLLVDCVLAHTPTGYGEPHGTGCSREEDMVWLLN